MSGLHDPAGVTYIVPGRVDERPLQHETVVQFLSYQRSATSGKQLEQCRTGSCNDEVAVENEAERKCLKQRNLLSAFYTNL